ncbi:MAG: hypothetical protein AAFR81_29810 [Chloroflexota bacterium]
MATQKPSPTLNMQFQKYLINVMWFTQLMLGILIMLAGSRLIWVVASSSVPLAVGLLDSIVILLCLCLIFFVVPQVKRRKKWAMITMLVFFLVAIIFYGLSFNMLGLGIALLSFGIYAYTFFRNQAKFS